LAPHSPFGADHWPYDHIWPAMGDPAPLTVNGQVLWPMPATPVISKNASQASPAAKKRIIVDEYALSDDASTSECGDSSSLTSDTSDGEDDKTDAKVSKCRQKGHKLTGISKAKKMPRITKDERTCVCDWIIKLRKDGKVPPPPPPPAPLLFFLIHARWLTGVGSGMGGPRAPP
jgi:hypothetical protein